MHLPDPRQLQLPLDSPDLGSPSESPSESASPARTKPKILRLPQLADPTYPTLPPATGKPALPGKRLSLKIGVQTLDYLLRRSKRRTVGFLIDSRGLRVTAPRWLTITAVEDAIRDKQGWILPRLDKCHQRLASPPVPPTEWLDGATLPHLGTKLTLRLVRGECAPPCLDQASGELVLTVPDYTTEHQIRELVQNWMQQEALRVFSERMPRYEAGLGVACKAFGLSSAITRWGSCSPAGRIRLNWRLIHFSLPLIDYVIVHELAHLLEMNHGPRFWAAVASVFPDYAQAKKTLREQAKEMMALF